jgi:deoxyribodipyrimidine photolyase-related protein
MNSYEGFFRQLIWREYQRYCYMFLHDNLLNKNKFRLTNRLTSEWYSGQTGVEPVDITIRKAFDTAYLHHIERLMIMGNFMLLSRIDKREGFKWFMEFSIDSYEWVMFQNVYDMVFFSTGGSTTHKAYISSSKYVIKMSDYKKGPWIHEWDKKYRLFKMGFRKIQT